MNKRASHVGMILSFVVFVTFLVFILSVLQPAFERTQDKENTLDVLEKNLIEKFKEPTAKITIGRDNIDPSIELTCIVFDSEEINNKFVIIKDSEGGLIGEGGVNSGTIYIGTIEEIVQIQIYPTNFITSSTLYPSVNTPCDGSEIKLIEREKKIFQKEIQDAIDEGYETLKGELEIPANENFAFEFLDKDKNEIDKIDSEIPNTEVFARDVAVFYIDENAEEQAGFIRLKVW